MEATSRYTRGVLVLSGLSILGVACSDSGSGSKSVVKETYSIDAFGYVDPNPPQPLQRVRTDVVLRDEMAILLQKERGQLLDYNQQPGGAVVTALPALPPETFTLTSGRIDLDSDMDVVAAHLRPYRGGGWAFELSHLEQTPAIAWMPVYSRPMPLNLRDVTMAAGDVDADGLDEIVVAFRWSSRTNVEVVVIDDLAHGAGVLESHAFLDECGDQLEVALGDLDGDGADEIVMSAVTDDCVAIEVVEASDPSNLFDDYFLRDRYAQPTFVRLGEFDDEPAQKELLVGFFQIEEEPPWAPLNLQYELVRLDLVEGALEETGSTRVGEWNQTVASNWVVADSDGDQADEIFLTCDGCVHVMRPSTLLKRPTWEHGIQAVARFDDRFDVQLAAGDEDADGRDEVFVMGRTELVRIGADRTGEFVVNERRDLGELPASPCLVVGDYDGDSTVIAYKDQRELVLCEAFPLIVMAAPPWKQKSRQQLAEATTAYNIEVGASHSTWSGATLTVPGAFGVDVDGLFKRRLLREFVKTETVPEHELDVEAFSASWREDKVLFCGALYQSYEYTVVADDDPASIGRRLTIDVPVDARTFFWSVEYYNETFERQITPRMLGHTVGDPASYMRFRDAEGLARRYVGWTTPEPKTVGSAGGYTDQGVRLKFPNATVAGWETPIEESAGLRTGPEWGKACLALASDQDLHCVTNRTATVFKGTVGDLPPKRHSTWGFDYGLLVYTRGHCSAADNTPLYCEKGALPFQVVTYAVDAWGSGY